MKEAKYIFFNSYTWMHVHQRRRRMHWMEAICSSDKLAYFQDAKALPSG